MVKLIYNLLETGDDLHCRIKVPSIPAGLSDSQEAREERLTLLDR